MVKSFLYLVAILASFFLLPVSGGIIGALILSVGGEVSVLIGAISGAILGICAWFRLVGHFVELDNINLISHKSLAASEVSLSSEAETRLAARDVRLGNHMMISGVVTFSVSLFFSVSSITLLAGGAGIILVATGFIISLTSVEFPSEDGIWRRVKLLLAKTRG